MLVANQRISEHLIYSEARCGCQRCDGGHLHWTVVWLFERIRARCSERLGRDCPIRVNSGARCALQNRFVGGSTGSKHLDGWALDLKTPRGLTRDEFWYLCEGEVRDGGLGKYTWGCHVDVYRADPHRRWDET